MVSFFITMLPPRTGNSPITDVQNNALLSCYSSKAEMPIAHLYANLSTKVSPCIPASPFPWLTVLMESGDSQPPLIGKCLRRDKGISATFQGPRVFFFFFLNT